MKPQELFNTVAKHLLTQNKKSEDDDGSCKYLKKDGCKCAAGCLIPPETYDPSWEGVRAIDILFFTREVCEGDEFTIRLLHALQQLHDATPILVWRDALRIVAARFKLDPAVCN